MHEFFEAMNNCLVQEVVTDGQFFTWSNKQHGNRRITSVLDRAFCNQAWSNLFPGWKYTVGSRFASDHAPLGEARIRKVERELQSLQLAADIRPSDRTLCENVQHKEAELDGMLHDEASLWQQKCRDGFAVAVDRNSEYFHSLYKFRQSINSISKLETEEG
ncbi:hypothetical protein FRX31_010279, partial [Thalictrum thalictroides]